MLLFASKYIGSMWRISIYLYDQILSQVENVWIIEERLHLSPDHYQVQERPSSSLNSCLRFHPEAFVPVMKFFIYCTNWVIEIIIISFLSYSFFSAFIWLIHYFVFNDRSTYNDQIRLMLHFKNKLPTVHIWNQF